jgi:hypothetical protein
MRHTVPAIAAFLLAATLSSPAPSQEEPLPPEAQAELERFRELEAPQARERARKFIEMYPDTRAAKILTRLLEEYAAFDRLKEEEFAAQQARTAWIREYWRARYAQHPLPAPLPYTLTLVNETDEPILFQAKSYNTVWTGPHRIRPGGVQGLYRPVNLRRMTSQGVEYHSLSPGNDYVFRATGPGAAELIQIPRGLPGSVTVLAVPAR